MKETQNPPRSLALRIGSKISELSSTVRERPVSTLIVTSVVLVFFAAMVWWITGAVAGTIPMWTTLPPT